MTTVNYLSLFTGIGGFDLGLDRAGHTCIGQCEKSAHCLSVLGKHWPDVKRWDDVATIKKETGRKHTTLRQDWIVGGFPCQDLSVAGRRAGLAGSRSGLFFEFVRIVGELAPGGFLIENVPGLLSSGERRDMGTVVGRLGQLGYGIAWRVLDAQWFGVAQQRRRVFIVGCAGADVRRAAEILFERESLPWDSPPSREAGARVARCVANGTGSSGQRYDGDSETFAYRTSGNCGAYDTGDRVDALNTFTDPTSHVVNCLDRHMGSGGPDDNAAQAGHLIASTIGTRAGDSTNNDGKKGSPKNLIVAHALTSEGADASEDGTGRGVPLVYNPHRTLQKDGTVTEGFAANSITNALHGPTGNKEPLVIPIGMRQASRGATMTNNRREGTSGGAPGTGIGEAGDPAPTVAGSHTPAVAFQESQSGFRERGQHPTLDSHNGSRRHHGVITGGVRRLTPKECERLQGFPDDWTRWGADGEELSDSARYRMIGNAVCVNVAQWLARRII